MRAVVARPASQATTPPMIRPKRKEAMSMRASRWSAVYLAVLAAAAGGCRPTARRQHRPPLPAKLLDGPHDDSLDPTETARTARPGGCRSRAGCRSSCRTGWAAGAPPRSVAPELVVLQPRSMHRRHHAAKRRIGAGVPVSAIARRARPSSSRFTSRPQHDPRPMIRILPEALPDLGRGVRVVGGERPEPLHEEPDGIRPHERLDVGLPAASPRKRPVAGSVVSTGIGRPSRRATAPGR